MTLHAFAYLWSGQHRDFFTYGRHDLAHDFTTLPENNFITTKSSHNMAKLPNNQLNMTKSSRYSATHPSINSTTT